MKVGEQVREARQARGLRVSELAERSGLTKGFVSQVETGRSNPSLASLQKLAAALSIDPAALLESGDGGRGGEITAGVTLPYVMRWRETRAPGVVRLPAVPIGVAGVINLVSGAQALGGFDRVEAGLAFCLVLEGEVEFSQGHAQLVLGRGDSLAWEQGTRYILANRGTMQAALLVAVGAGSNLPAVEAPAKGPRRVPQREFTEASQAAGPLRLAAMRAQRHKSGGR